MIILNPEAEHKFRMNGGSLDGELVIFDVDAADGKVTAVKMGKDGYSLRLIR
jgi:hypothetical protein